MAHTKDAMTTPDTPHPKFALTALFSQHWQKIVSAGVWLAIIVSYTLYARAHALTPLAAAQTLADTIRGTAYGPLIYIVVYALRPLLFFPGTPLTVAGGFLFGPIFGVIYTVIGSNNSAMLSYVVGRYFGQGVFSSETSTGVIHRFTERLRQSSFETVLTMRFIFLPYDLVSYLCGFLKIDWRAFLLASALGTIPGTISFVALGASITGKLTDFTPQLDPLTLGVGVLMFVLGLVLSRYFRRREAKPISETIINESSTAE
ncbi:MAG: TVP38/TMEM64 family protein [Chloroflexi bacterium]|nr:TVP38/TMEM64 family protein [Chloroflexota bacterium]